MAYNFKHLANSDEILQKFTAISDPNSISPATLADTMGAIAKEVDDNIRYIFNEDGGEIMVFFRIGCNLQGHLNGIYDRLNNTEDESNQ